MWWRRVVATCGGDAGGGDVGWLDVEFATSSGKCRWLYRQDQLGLVRQLWILHYGLAGRVSQRSRRAEDPLETKRRMTVYSDAPCDPYGPGRDRLPGLSSGRSSPSGGMADALA